MARPFQIVDVFGSDAFSGNPVAVVHDADRMTTNQMMAITRWMNLSETTFLMTPTDARADYRLRIFTLRGELPFAGHPTLGSCHAWLTAGGVPAGQGVVQECGIGLVPLRRGERLSFAAPPLIRRGPVEAAFLEDIAAVLGVEVDAIVDAHWVDNGPGWVGILLADRDSVLALEPEISRYEGQSGLNIGVVAPHGGDDDIAFEIRAFFADERNKLVEDPVTGSLNASLAQWLIGSGQAPKSYITAQGTALGRAGRIHITSEGSDVWVGGATVSHVSGEISLD